MASAAGTWPRRVAGLMSGTSMDGVDVAVLDTDGEQHVALVAHATVPYSAAQRSRIRAQLGQRQRTAPVLALEEEVTALHAQALRTVCADADIALSSLHCVGFHGQTLSHAPQEGHTLQIGDGAALAADLGLVVVNDFRTADVQEGGQGAPLVPLYHAALARQLMDECAAADKAPAKAGDVSQGLAVVNVGGVSNITYIPPPQEGCPAPLLAFDCGPGGAYIDDYMLTTCGREFDAGGALAAAGAPHLPPHAVDAFMQQEFFAAPPPKSLDRHSCDGPTAALLQAIAAHMSEHAEQARHAAAVAALTEASAAAIAAAAQHLPTVPRVWLVTGGGRHNATLLARVAARLPEGTAVAPVDTVGWDGDAMEAAAFGFLAVRSLRGLHLTEPGTTGCRKACTGGVTHLPPEAPTPAPAKERSGGDGITPSGSGGSG